MRTTLFVTMASLVLAEFVVMTVRPVAARQQRRVVALALRVPVPIWSLALTVYLADVAWHLRDHCFGTELFTLRRTDDSARNLRSGSRRQRQYEIRYPSGEYHVVTLRQIDAILNRQSFPADFWAVVSAADAAFASGDMDVLIEWPSGRRTIALAAMVPPRDDEWVITNVEEHDWGWVISWLNKRAARESTAIEDTYAGR